MSVAPLLNTRNDANSHLFTWEEILSEGRVNRCGEEILSETSCLSVSRVETGTPGGGGCLSETRVLVSLSEVLVSLSEVLVSGS